MFCTNVQYFLLLPWSISSPVRSLNLGYKQLKCFFFFHGYKIKILTTTYCSTRQFISIECLNSQLKVKTEKIILRGHRSHDVKLAFFVNLLAELSFVTLTIHLCNGLNDKNFFKLRKMCFLTV